MSSGLRNFFAGFIIAFALCAIIATGMILSYEQKIEKLLPQTSGEEVKEPMLRNADMLIETMTNIEIETGKVIKQFTYERGSGRYKYIVKFKDS